MLGALPGGLSRTADEAGTAQRYTKVTLRMLPEGNLPHFLVDMTSNSVIQQLPHTNRAAVTTMSQVMQNKPAVSAKRKAAV